MNASSKIHENAPKGPRQPLSLHSPFVPTEDEKPLDVPDFLYRAWKLTSSKLKFTKWCERYIRENLHAPHRRDWEEYLHGAPSEFVPKKQEVTGKCHYASCSTAAKYIYKGKPFCKGHYNNRVRELR